MAGISTLRTVRRARESGSWTVMTCSLSTRLVCYCQFLPGVALDTLVMSAFDQIHFRPPRFINLPNEFLHNTFRIVRHNVDRLEILNMFQQRANEIMAMERSSEQEYNLRELAMRVSIGLLEKSTYSFERFFAVYHASVLRQHECLLGAKSLYSYFMWMR